MRTPSFVLVFTCALPGFLHVAIIFPGENCPLARLSTNCSPRPRLAPVISTEPHFLKFIAALMADCICPCARALIICRRHATPPAGGRLALLGLALLLLRLVSLNCHPCKFHYCLLLVLVLHCSPLLSHNCCCYFSCSKNLNMQKVTHGSTLFSAHSFWTLDISLNL